MNKHEEMYQEIKKHGKQLNKIFKTQLDDVTLSKKLFSLEHKAAKLALDYCNGENGVNTDNWEALTDKVLASVDKVIGYKAKGIPVFVNGDARGSALKIDDSYVTNNNLEIHKDWGGFGILAPDFNR